jgi:NAD(P)-dependent dehydrogenase (short-subunit alcohol dehydrogenase family)
MTTNEENGRMEIAAGRRALVTGGASGFGREIATRLAAEGCAVAVLDVDGERADEVAAELGQGALGVAADVRSPSDLEAAVARTVAAFGGLDTLVVSAGIFTMGAIGEVSEQDWDRTIDINLKGAFLTLQAAAPALRASGRGRAVTISSDAGRRGFPTQSVYVASKFGLIGLTESIAAELAGDGVTVNCVCPVNCPTTSMGQDVLRAKVEREHVKPESVIASAARSNPLGRNATERDVADAVLFLVSEHASFLTGVVLDIDGGARLGTVPGLD